MTRSLLHGVVAGLAGTAAITVAQLAGKRLQGERLDTPVPHRWADAPPPARVAKRAAELVGHGSKVTRDDVPRLTNVVHWLYGLTWGLGYGLVAGRLRPSTLAGAGALSGAVWAASYAELVPLGIQKPPWKYPVGELSLDVSYHAVYGAAVAATFSLLEQR
jgi:hypothetical protein